MNESAVAFGHPNSLRVIVQPTRSLRVIMVSGAKLRLVMSRPIRSNLPVRAWTKRFTEAGLSRVETLIKIHPAIGVPATLSCTSYRGDS